jgi:hypothetical protein
VSERLLTLWQPGSRERGWREEKEKKEVEEEEAEARDKTELQWQTPKDPFPSTGSHLLTFHHLPANSEPISGFMHG